MHQAYWKNLSTREFPKLHENAQGRQYDVIIVGGGITGLSAAYFLKRAGKSVCVLEKNRIGSGDTGSTTAHLTCVTDLRLQDLVKKFGEDSALAAWQGGQVAIDAIESIVKEHGIECDFERVTGYLHVPWDQNLSEREAENFFEDDLALAELMELPAEFRLSVPVVGKPGIAFAHQAKFHPLAYLRGLAEVVQGGVCDIFEGAEVTEIQENPLRVSCGDIEIGGDYLVLATHVPLAGVKSMAMASLFQTKIAPYSSYVVGAKLPKFFYPRVLLWDTEDPYSYLRIDRHEDWDYAIFGGRDHKTGQVDATKQCFESLEKRLIEIFPDAKLDRRWSGQVVESHDGLPLIGENASKQFVATGFAGNGMTFGTLAGLMARDAFFEKKNAWKNLFSPGRLELHGAWDYVKENKDFPLYFLADRMKKVESFDPEKISVGEGKLQRIGTQTAACARDESGKLHITSAVCTHMGGLVHWNSAEKTWDCPCHGSRFDMQGRVVAGPAEKPLEKVEAPLAASKERWEPLRNTQR